MTGATYVDLVRAAGGPSLCTVRRVAEALGCKGTPLSEFDALRILVVERLYTMGFSRAVAVELLEEFSAEALFISRSAENEAWALLAEPLDAPAFRIGATSKSHLAALTSAIPMALVIPLHRLWEDAAARLRKAQRAAGAQGESA